MALAQTGTLKAPETSSKSQSSTPKGDNNAKTSTTLPKAPDSFSVAAEFLDKVCARAGETQHGISIKNLAIWINPNSTVNAESKSTRDSIISDVIQHSPLYIGGLDAKRKYYKEQTEVFMAAVAAAARKWAHDHLSRQSRLLAELSFASHYQAERIHVVAVEVRKKSKSFVLSVLTPAEFEQATNKSGRQKDVLADRIKRLSYMQIIGGSRSVSQATARSDPNSRKPNVKADNTYEVLYLLMVHPRGVDLVDAYARSAAEGRTMAGNMINESSRALVETESDLDSDAMLIWRLPVALTAGAATLGLARRPNLTKFSLAWAATQKTRIESALEIGMNATMVLDLVGGPIGAEISAVLNVVLSAIGTAVSFLQDVQQDQAARATAFNAENERLSEGANSVGTILQGVATIVAAAALPGVVSRVTGRASAPMVQSPARLPPANEFDSRLLNRSVGTDAAITAENRATQNSVKAADPEAKALQRGLRTAPAESASTAQAKAVQSGIEHAAPEAKAVERGLASIRTSSRLQPVDDEAVNLMRTDPEILAQLQKAHPLAGHNDPSIELRAQQKVAASAAEYQNVEAQANLNRSRGTAPPSRSGRERSIQEQSPELSRTRPGGSRSTAPVPERLDSVPEPPLLEKAIRKGNYSQAEVLEFYQKNRGEFPLTVQRLIDALPKKNPSWGSLEAVDKAIRDAHTELANRLAGFPENAQGPFIRSVRGTSNEGGRVNSILTDDKILTLVGRYSGGTAEFDSVQFTGARIIERKLNLKWTRRDGVVVWVRPDDVFTQMLHQAEFVSEWKKWSLVEWSVHDEASYKFAQGIHARLEAIHPELASRVKVKPFE